MTDLNRYMWCNWIVATGLALSGAAACASESSDGTLSDDGELEQATDVVGVIADRRARVIARREFSQSMAVARAQEFLAQRGIQADTSFKVLNADTTTLDGQSIPILVAPSPIKPVSEIEANDLPSTISRLQGAIVGEAPAYLLTAIGMGPVDETTGFPRQMGLIEAVSVPIHPLAEHHEITNVHAAVIELGPTQDATEVRLFRVPEVGQVVDLMALTGAELTHGVLSAKQGMDAYLAAHVDEALDTLLPKLAASPSETCQTCKENAMQRSRVAIQAIVNVTFYIVLGGAALVLGIVTGTVLATGSPEFAVQLLAPLRKVILPAAAIPVVAVAWAFGYGLYKQATMCHDVC
ncbi:MAG: hypothetical protein H6715_05645 [Myxococcales bacterium]|nr:hypothetical protein [Myxococcales bacterium]MCB9707916.1 hypothetical protein [Myxococcales bacterium]